MLWIIALLFVSETLAEYGDLRIREGGDSGLLEFYDGYWYPICRDGFDDDAGDVACRQLGYAQSSDVYVHSSSYYYGSSNKVCGVTCTGDEVELTDCYIPSYYCTHYCDIVGITCTSLSAGAIIGIVFGSLAFIAVIVAVVIVCICCLRPSCLCYYKKHSRYNKHPRTTSTTVAAQAAPQVATQQAPQVVTQQVPQVVTQPAPQVVTQPAPQVITQQAPQVVAVFTTTDAKYNPAPPAAYVPYPSYQPYPTEPPPPTGYYNY